MDDNNEEEENGEEYQEEENRVEKYNKQEKVGKDLNKEYKKKLEELKKQITKELKLLNNKLDKAQKNKKGYYELFIIENDINIKLELVERNLKTDEEKAHHNKLKNEFFELKNDLANIRGEELL